MIVANKLSEKYTVFPIKYPSLWKFYKQHIGTFWTVEEVQLAEDITDWETKLTESEKYFIKNVLAFFASSDGIVNENLVLNFYNDTEIAEARAFYTIQMLIESCHGEQYSLLIDTYIKDNAEKEHLFNAIETVPAIKKKADWIIKWISEGSSVINAIPAETMRAIKDAENAGVQGLSFFTKSRPSFAQRLVAFVFVEGLFFSGSFCAIYWLKNRGLMPGLCKSNSYISRDEALHGMFAVELYRTTCSSLDKEIVHGICREAVEIEKEFITSSLPVSLIGMNCNLMSKYIEYVADRWLVLLGYEKIYNSENPFAFMELISLHSKVNFFERVNSEYQKSSVGQSLEDRNITFDSDF